MSIKDKLLNTKEITRRTFLKGASAVGATAALYGCGGGSAGKTYMEEDTTLETPKITETVVPGSTPHNCGGRCVSRYYVRDGVVKRIVTDENTDNNALGTAANDPQRRSCVRCRSRKQWFYRNDRLLYPLKQTGQRGDINGFQRITWEQAFQEIGEKLASIVNDYGPESLHKVYASADSTGWSAGSVNRLFNMHGGSLPYRDDYSWPALDHVATFTEGTGYIPQGNSRGDVVNADHVILWSYNGLEAIWGTQSGWYLTQAKEQSIPFTAIDTRLSKTAATLADDYINITPCTDSALVLAIMYYLLKERRADLDIPFIQSHVHGFFDDPAATSYHSSITAGSYVVPNGASLSAYIFGTETTLVDDGLNGAISVYPDTIGYNVNATDPLFGKRAPIYGQNPKTPEWASAITGVPVATIKSLADTLLDNNCSIWNGSGFQRNTESEQIVWLMRILSAVTKNFGAAGCSYGMQPWSWVSGPSNGLGSGYSSTVDVSSQVYDASEMVTTDFYANGTSSSIPVFTWPDAVENGGTGSSRWNDGQIKSLNQGIKCIFNFGGNVLANQSGDVNLLKSIMTDRSKAELLVTGDYFMTSSALVSDYVLPCTMQMEKPGASTGWFSEEVVFVNEVLDIPGEVKSEYDICAGIASQSGFTEADYTEGKTMMERLKEGWDAKYNDGYYDITWDEFKEAGIWKADLPISILYKDFRDDPANNPLDTPSGKFEAYSQWMMEDYQARHYDNFDSSGVLANGGSISDTKTGASTSRRFVYPIPMYIPTVEGMHADGSHPDLTDRIGEGYEFILHTWHMMYRSHSSLNNVAYLDENYKQDRDGKPAFLDPDRDWSDGVWDDGVYEPCWLNPADANSLGISSGDRVKISNDRGTMYASAVATQRVPSGVVYIGQGSWHSDKNGIDVGGCANTMTTARPSRICQGMTLANDCRIKIVKA